MRLAALAVVATLARVGPGWGETGADYLAKVQAELDKAPGDYVGWVPGAYLRQGMKPLPGAALQTVPVIDVDKGCKGVVACVTSEQEAYDELKYLWEDLNMNDRNVCLVTATYDSQGMNIVAFYKRLRVCVNVRIGARETIEQNKQKHFQP